jgi:predicted DNA-binding transcriptional regulator YafY
MDRINRLVGIMLLLQSHRVIRAEDMAQHFGISVRTVYRDLKALEEAGLPLAAEAGKGYSIVEGYHLPPVMFNQEEASALFIGGEFAERLTDSSLRTHVRSALLKIRAVLPDDRRDFLERLQKSTAIYTRNLFDGEELPPCLALIHDALVRRRVLRMTYYTNYRDDTSQRDVEPLGTIFYGDQWHLIAFCRQRHDVRDFRVDRISSIVMLDEVFPEHVDFSLRNYMETSRRQTNLHEARVLFAPAAARNIAAKHFFGFVEQVETDDGVEVHFLTPSLQWLATWILSYGTSAKALYPEELRTIAYDIARSVVGQYEQQEELV